MNMEPSAKLEYRVSARRVDAHGSEARTKEASVLLDTDVAGRVDAFNPAELLLASLGACMIKGAERAIPMIHLRLNGMEVHLHAVRQDSPPMIAVIEYEFVVDTDENDHRNCFTQMCGSLALSPIRSLLQRT